MRFVDNQRVVGGEIAVGLRFGEQDAIGHQLDAGIARSIVVKPHFVTHRLPNRLPQLFGNALGNRTRGKAAWLRMPNQTRRATPERQADFRQLRGFARTRFAANNRYLIVLNRGFYVI